MKDIVWNSNHERYCIGMFSFWKTLNLDITLLGNLDSSSKTLTHYEIIRELLKDIEYAFTCSCKDI